MKMERMEEWSLMDFKGYQKIAYKHLKPHDSLDMEKLDWSLGLAGEAGEVIELVKHNIMHKESIDLEKLAKEIGDVVWYCSALATAYGLDFDTITRLNLAKLEHRHQGSYSTKSSEERHQREKKFSDTISYLGLIKQLALREE